jgi:phosphoglycolate phosphatase
MAYKAVIFDLDGTLLDTLEDLADSANRVLRAQGLPDHPVDAYRYFVGDGLATLIRRITPEESRTDELLDRLFHAFKEDYGRNWHNKSRMYEGIDTMLDGLTRGGLRLSVLSNKPHEFTRVCVQRFLAGWTFDPVLGARPEVPRKPDPSGAIEIAGLMQLDPSEILYMGDTATDMKTAKGASMFAVGALWGFRTAEELTESGADRLIADPRELLELI